MMDNVIFRLLSIQTGSCLQIKAIEKETNCPTHYLPWLIWTELAGKRGQEQLWNCNRKRLLNDRTIQTGKILRNILILL